MILSSAQAPDFLSAVRRLSPGNPFACRILSLYNSYHPDLAFVDYWLVCDSHGVCSGAIARNGSNFILLLTDETDLEEVSSFMRVAGATGILLDGSYRLDFPGEESSGVVMQLDMPVEEADDSAQFVTPDIKAAYGLLVRCAGEGFAPPVFEDFYVDVNHKLRHGAMRLVGVEEGGILAAIAMTVAESESGAVLGAVACAPEFRRKGYASAVVTHTVNALLRENKTVFLHRARHANAVFYEKLGFTECGSWREYNTKG